MCLNPITIKVEQSYPNAPLFRMVQVPCGKCNICVQKYQNSWSIRLQEELKNWSKSLFITLTYSNDHVPIMVQKSTGEYHLAPFKQHIQDWLKLFRTRYKREFGTDANFKYYICSELGPSTFRPHYHGIIFGFDKIDFHYALSDWRKKYGFVTAKNIDLTTQKSRANTSRYVAKYCLKGEFENIHIKEGTLPKNFRLMSKGIGLSYVQKHRDDILNHIRLSESRLLDIADKLKYNSNGFAYALPRYFKDKILPPKTLLRYKVADALLARNDALYLDKSRSLQANLSISENEAVNLMALQELDALRQRDDEIKERLNSHYKKSKI